MLALSVVYFLTMVLNKTVPKTPYESWLGRVPSQNQKWNVWSKMMVDCNLRCSWVVGEGVPAWLALQRLTQYVKNKSELEFVLKLVTSTGAYSIFIERGKNELTTCAPLFLDGRWMCFMVEISWGPGTNYLQRPGRFVKVWDL